MPSAELVIFLPLIGAILGAVVGGFVGAYANSWYRDREAKKAQNAERQSLLFLIGAEVRFNYVLINAISFGPPSGPIDSLQTAIWDKVHTCLARLLTVEFMHDLVAYYGFLKIQQMSPLANEQEALEHEPASMERMQTLGEQILREVQKYIEDPNFVDVAELDLVEDFKRKFSE